MVFDKCLYQPTEVVYLKLYQIFFYLFNFAWASSPYSVRSIQYVADISKNLLLFNFSYSTDGHWVPGGIFCYDYAVSLRHL